MTHPFETVRRRAGWLAGILALVSVLLAPGQAAAGGSGETLRVPARASFNGQAFSYTMELLREGARHRCYALTYPSPLVTKLTNNNVVPAEYYVPANLKPGDPGRPAVICLHILNGNFELERMICTLLAEAGVPAILFKLPYYGERSPVQGRNALMESPDLFTQCLRQAGLDVRRTVDLLCSRPEVDPKRIGVTGISLGALLAGSACGAEPRLQRASLILGGGDLRRIIGTAREARDLREALARATPPARRAVEAALDQADPLTHAAALRRLAKADRLMMINAAEDEVIPPDCSRRLAAVAGLKDRMIWLEGMGHYTALAALPRIMRETVAFFALDLPPGISPPAVPPSSETSPVALVGSLLQQVSQLGSRTPPPGRCHYVDLRGCVVTGEAQTNVWRLTYVRGEAGQFHLLAGPSPALGTVNLGCGTHPWIVTRAGGLLTGSGGGGAAPGLADLLDAPLISRLQLAGAVLAAVAAAPEAFAAYVQVTEEAGTATERVVRVQLNHKDLKGSGRVRFQRQTLAPLSLDFTGAGMAGTIAFRLWSLDAVSSPELYREPAATPAQELPRAEVLRRCKEILSAVAHSVG